MARIRTLKPEFWHDEKMAPLAPIHRLVFLGLISQADDGGRLVDNVRLLDGLLFPETEDSCAPSLAMLAELGRIRRYVSASGQRLIQVEGWEKHQKVKNPSEYTLPAPSTETGGRVGGESTENQTPRSPIPDPPYPIPDQGSPIPPAGKAPSPLDELIAFVGEVYRPAVEAVAKLPRVGAGWASGVMATWGRESLESRQIPKADRPEVLGMAFRRFSTDADSWNSRYFKPFVASAYTDLLEHRAAQAKSEEARERGSTADAMKAAEAADIERLNELGRVRGFTPPTDPSLLVSGLAERFTLKSQGSSA